MPGQIRRHPCPAHCLGRGAGATVSAQHRQRLGHRGIRHAAALDRDPHRSRGGARPAERAHPGDPAADRTQPARGHRSDRLGERQIRIDCDVLQADGGTRTAAITGSYVALHQVLQRLVGVGQPAAPALAEQRRRGLRRRGCRPRGARPRLRRGFAGDDRREFRADRGRRHRRDPGDRRRRPVRRRAVRRDAAAGAGRHRPPDLKSDDALGLGST